MLFGRFLWGLSRVVATGALVVGIVGNWNDTLQTKALLGLTWQQFAFSLLAITVIGVVIELEIKRNKLEKSRPRITVRPLVSENKRLILEVINDGFGGDFSAKARIRSGSPVTDSLDLQWETNGQVRYHIDGGGGEATLLLGIHPKRHTYDAISQKPPSEFHSGELQLLTFKSGQPYTLHLYDWKFNPSSDQVPHYECEIEVTITSEPTLLKPFKRIPYKIMMDGLNLDFNEILASHE